MTAPGSARSAIRAAPFERLAHRLAAIPHMNVLLAAVLTLCVVRLWLMPLPSSFWVDEMATAFVVRQGANDPSLRVAPQVPASLYYVLPQIAQRVWGLSEIAYRIPSVLALGAALVFIARIAATLIHPQAGWLAAIACLSLRGFNYEAADARPYALGTQAASASIWLLIRWLNSGRWRDGLLFAAAASLLWRVHLIFWPLYVLFAIYTLVRFARADTPAGWRRVAAVFALIGAALVPVAREALVLGREAAAHVIVPKPSANELIHAVKIGMVAGFGAVAFAAGRLFRTRPRFTTSRSSLVLIAGWWLCLPLCLFAFSWLTGNSVFVPRYLFVALPGAALAATAAASAFLPHAEWKPLSLVFAAGVLLTLGQWNEPWPSHHNSGWRTAAVELSRQGLASESPVICPSPFIEARPPVWRPGYPVNTFLYSHLLVYSIPGNTYMFPFESSPEAQQYARRLSRETLARSKRFAIYGGDSNVRLWRDWFASRPELARWRNRRLGPFGDVDAVVFERSE